MSQRGLRPQPRLKSCQSHATSSAARFVASVLTLVTLVSFCGKHSSVSCCFCVSDFLATKRHKTHKRTNGVSRESLRHRFSTSWYQSKSVVKISFTLFPGVAGEARAGRLAYFLAPCFGFHRLACFSLDSPVQNSPVQLETTSCRTSTSEQPPRTSNSQHRPGVS